MVTRQDWGAVLVPEGVRFTLYSEHAEAVEVCLFDSPCGEKEHRRVALESRSGGIWQGLVAGIGAGQLYGFRVHGSFDPGRGHRFNPSKLLTDPYALALTGEPPLDDAFSGSHPDDAEAADLRDTGSIAAKSIVVDRQFDWQGDALPATSWEKTIIYECHVRGMSKAHPDVPESLRGTYAGLVSEPVLDHLSALGITAIELLPVQQIASEPQLQRRGLQNYFGYSPLGFFAPHAGYASDPLGGQVAEFKSMVRGLHRRGIEVILDLVLNHTAEGDALGRTLSLRGIDNLTYYRLHKEDPRLYADITGCGNSIAADHPVVARLLVDCLRYWAEEMHVDGFRLDLAVTLGRTDDGFSAQAPFFELLSSDPVLARRKLIAEPWDLGTDGYQLGQFPTGWSEWNDRFRDTTRRAWRCDPTSGVAFSRTFDGSPEIFEESGKGAEASIHFITCHDGFTLEDLVSYERKNNWDNGEDNRDGHDHNLSHNWGIEGPAESPEIRERRARAKRNMLATVLLSAGVPMLQHGDELGRSQGGNNNAYCQDGPLTWVDWGTDSEIVEFVERLIALRTRLAPFSGVDNQPGERLWLAATGKPLDLEPENHDAVVGLMLHRPARTHLLIFNLSDQDSHFQLPQQQRAGRWNCVLSTVHSAARPHEGSTRMVEALSTSVLEFEAEPVSTVHTK